MEKAVHFIKTFEPSIFGLDILDLWIGFGLIISAVILANFLNSFLHPTRSKRIRKYINIVFYITFGGILILVVLNSLLTERYDRLMVMAFIFILPYLKKWGWRAL